MHPFEQQVLADGGGNAQEKLRRLYGKDITYHNAKKYLAGIKMHILHLEKIGAGTAVPPEQAQHYSHEETTFNKDQTQTVKRDVYLTPEEAAAPTSIMKKCGFDPLLWEVVTCKLITGSWDVTLKNADGEGVLHTNRKYSVTLTVKPLGGNLTSDQVLEIFKNLPEPELTEYQYRGGKYLLELPIMDFHLGKLAWGEETGGQDYNLKIAEKLWRKTVVDLLSKAGLFGKPELILFPIGQDFFHFDTPTTTTTAGTQLDSDTRWQKMYSKGVELLVWAVEQCRAIAPVKIIWIPGNHDTVLSYTATVGLAQRYAECKGVEVDLSPMRRKYFSYGSNLIGFAHGVEEGKRIEGLMQVEAPEAWGESVWREYHLGHLHTENTLDKGGIVFRRISSITAADAWHSENGFVGTTRRAQAFVWDKERGLQAIVNSNVRV